MFIAKYENKVVGVGETKDKLIHALSAKCKVWSSVEETSESYVLYEGNYVLESEISALRSAKAANIALTAADVERALYRAKQIDFDDVLAKAAALGSVDAKALKIELKANHFYRKNPYVNQIGALLGITPNQLDEFFLTNDYTKLIS